MLRSRRVFVVQDELIAMRYMKPKADAALAEKASAKAAKARRRQGMEQRQAFRRFTTPGGLQARHHSLGRGLDAVELLSMRACPHQQCCTLAA